ncbi:MAG: VIT1/CCC1 transporter family protein [Nanobdellota archaeon]
MKHSLRKGIGFGITSGIITTLGLIVGLHSGTGSRTVVISGIVVIAIADGLSDALGVHISEEADHRNSHTHVWESTICTFLAKFLTAMLFMIPLLLLEINTAIIASITMGMALIGLFSYYIAVKQGESPWKPVFEHLLIAILVVIVTHLIGSWLK